MRNFDEHNHFEAYFSVMDDVGAPLPDRAEHQDDIDLQVLGEGGHLLYEVTNTLGIIAKDANGYGIPYARGALVDGDGELLSEFVLNEVGMAKSIFIPRQSGNYTVQLYNGGRTITRPIDNIDSYGMAMSLSRSSKGVTAMVVTNETTLDRIQKDSFNIALHNGRALVASAFTLNDRGEAQVVFPKENLFRGVNILTVFKNNKPVLERMFFNSQGIEQLRVRNTSVEQIKDSLQLKLRFNKNDLSEWSNFSVSVLPTGTKSYGHHNNLLSQLFIQPYISGRLEKGWRYFRPQTPELAQDLDLLMLTQGWSSYRWNNIFNHPPSDIYEFEKGLRVVANINSKDDQDQPPRYMLYTGLEDSPTLFEVEKQETSFELNNMFPTEDRSIFLSELTKRSGAIPARLYLQSFPSTIPKLRSKANLLKPEKHFSKNDGINNNLNEFITLNAVQVLDQVTVISDYKKRQARVEELEKKSRWSDIYVFDDMERQKYRSFIEFINMATTLRARATNLGSDIEIYNPRAPIAGGAAGSQVTIYFDNVLLVNTSILSFFPMQFIDYIEINRSGLGNGIWGQFGVIKIFTGPEYKMKRAFPNANSFELPLVFNEEKRYYVPKYPDYQSDFFRDYGTIDWKPRLELNNNNELELKVKNNEVPFTIYLEGITQAGSFISLQQDISLNEY
jgi:hypothetical protein